MRSDMLLLIAAGSTGRCSSVTLASSTRSPSSRHPAGSACPTTRCRTRSPCSRHTTRTCRFTGSPCPGACPPPPPPSSPAPSTRSPDSAPPPPRTPGDLEFTASGIRNSADATLDVAARSGWALHELPARHTIRTDREAAEAAAGLAARLLARRAVGTCERHPRRPPLGPQDIAIGVAHRDQADQIRQALAQAVPARRRDDQGRHRQPAAGRRIRDHHRPAPALRAARRDSFPPRSGPPVRSGLPAPARLHRRRPRRDSRRSSTPTPPTSPSTSASPPSSPTGGRRTTPCSPILPATG